MKHFLVRCLVTVGLTVSIFAQPPTSNTDQAEKAKQEREKIAFAWLDAIITEAKSLKLAENRAYVLAMAADTLWTKDEARARALYLEAAGMLAQIMNGIESDDPSYYNRLQSPSQLRQQMLQSIAQRDAQLALEILRSTRPPTAPDQMGNAYNPEAHLEAQLARQAAQTDPVHALQMAEESLEKGYANGLLETITQLQTKDPEAARSLAGKLLSKLKGEDLIKNMQASGMANSVLYLMNDSANSQAASTNKQALFSEQSKKEFIEMIVATKLKAAGNSAEGGAPQLTYGLQQMMPLVEKYAPTQAAALRRILPPPPPSFPAQTKANEELQQLQQKGSVEQLLAFAKTSAPELSTQAYIQAVGKAIEQGEIARAREIINTQVPPEQRRNLQASFDLTLMSRVGLEGKLEEARRELARMQPPENKAMFWLEMVNIVMRKGDKKTALELLQEARTFLGNRPNNANQFPIYLQLARSFAQFDPDQGIELLEPLVAQLNTLIAASEVLDEFEQRNGFQNGEMRMPNAGNWTIPRLLQQFAGALADVASSDADRCKTIIDRFDRDETRLVARLAVVQKLLRSAPNSEGVGEIRRGGARIAPLPPPPPPIIRE